MTGGGKGGVFRKKEQLGAGGKERGGEFTAFCPPGFSPHPPSLPPSLQ